MPGRREKRNHLNKLNFITLSDKAQIQAAEMRGSMQKAPALKGRSFLAAGEGFELSKRVKLRKTEQKKALIINTFLKLTEITDKGK